MSPRIAAVLLALVPAVGVAVAAPAPPPKPDPKEQEAAAALQKAGFELEVAKDDPRRRVTVARWSRTAREATLTAAGLARLRELPHLTWLSLRPVEGEPFVVDDEAAGHLAALRGLEHFVASRVDFRPGTLARLASAMPRLRMLHIYSGRFAGEELDAAGKLPKLLDLDLSGTDVTDADLGRLGKKGAFPKLESLFLYDCEKVTPGGVAALRKARPKLNIYGGPKPTDRWAAP